MEDCINKRCDAYNSKYEYNCFIGGVVRDLGCQDYTNHELTKIQESNNDKV